MSASQTNTRTVARNSFWYGLEMALGVAAVFGVSIPMARVLGPEQIGYYNYIAWLSNITGLLGSAGIPSTTMKYLAEYVGKGELAIARSVFFATLRAQTAVATIAVVGALAAVYLFGDPAHRTVSTLQVLGIFPHMLGFIPAQTNVARENMRANVVGSVLSSVVQVAAVGLSLTLGWQLTGIAAGILIARWLELIVRLVPVWRWIRTLPVGRLPDDVRAKMVRFSGQSLLLLALYAIIWDRSDIVLLKLRSLDIAQITFFSVGFNLSDKVLLIPQVFGSALGTTMNAQYGRSRAQLNKMVAQSLKYMVLITLPVLIGLASISSPLIRLMYGRLYLQAIPVLAVAAIFAIAKPMLLPPQEMLRVNEEQGFLLTWSCICGGLNVALDWILIPKYGAVGAAIGNGCGQTVAVLGLWVVVARKYSISFDTRVLLRIAGAAAGIGPVVLPAVWFLPPLPAVCVAIIAGTTYFLLALRATRVFNEEDRLRMIAVRAEAPALVRPLVTRMADFLTLPEKPAPASTR